MWDFFNESFFAPVLSDTHHFHTDIKDDGDHTMLLKRNCLALKKMTSLLNTIIII